MTGLKRVLLLAGCLVALGVPSSAGALSRQPVGSFNEPIFVTAPSGDQRLFVVERGGTIQVLHDGTRSEFLNITSLVRNTGEQGLLSMAFDPNFASNGLFYVFFNGSTADPTIGDIHVDEFRVTGNPNLVDPATRRKVMTIVRGNSGTTNHNGGQLQFGKDGRLYITVGDNANGANAQTLSNPHGKLLRIDPHGVGNGAHGIPPDNPFLGSPTPEIWSLGLRNPYRFSFDHLTGDLVIADVGAGTAEEMDFAPAASGLGKGANYGWPSCEGFSGSCAGFTPPVFAYGRSAPCNAIIGGYVYRGSRAPEILGRYLYTDLCHPDIRSLQPALPLATGDRSEGVSAPDSPVSFGEDANCDLYVMGGSTVDRIVGSAASAAPACQAASAVKKKCKKKKKKHRAAAGGKKKKKKTCKKKKPAVEMGWRGS
jgi:glucose/arabinose dehydrogenase